MLVLICMRTPMAGLACWAGSWELIEADMFSSRSVRFLDKKCAYLSEEDYENGALITHS